MVNHMVEYARFVMCGGSAIIGLKILNKNSTLSWFWPALTHTRHLPSVRAIAQGAPPMTDDHDPKRLNALEERIAAAKKAQAPTPRADEHYSQAQLAWRMVIELVAGLGIGVALGLGLDSLLGTRPIFLVVFTLLGFAAGVNVMMRTAREAQDKAVADATERDEGT